jgi:hypothetical protein
VSDLAAPEYREALILVLAELEDLDLSDRWATAEHLGRLKVHIATVAGTVSPPMEPIYGLRALRRYREPVDVEERWDAARVEDERAAEAEHADQGEL